MIFLLGCEMKLWQLEKLGAGYTDLSAPASFKFCKRAVELLDDVTTEAHANLKLRDIKEPSPADAELKWGSGKYYKPRGLSSRPSLGAPKKAITNKKV